MAEKKIYRPVVKEKIGGFMHFVREQGVVGLAVGLVLGTAVKSIVDSLVNNIITPLIGLVTGGSNFSNKYACLKSTVIDGISQCENKLGYGSVISSILSFMTVAAIVYFVVRGLKLDRLDLKKDS